RLAEVCGFMGVEQGLVGCAEGVRTPYLLAGLGVVGSDMPAHAELRSGDADDDLVLDRQYGRGVGLALLRVAVDNLPLLFACLGVERDQRRISLVVIDRTVGLGRSEA